MKLVYLALGLALAIISALGNMMWIERRRHGGEGTKSDRFCAVLCAINTGVCADLPLASVAVLAFDKLWWGSEVARYSSVAIAFWVFGAIYDCARGGDYKANRELLAATGLSFVALAPLNWIVTGDTMWCAFGNGAAGSAWFDLSFIVLGGLTLALVVRLPGGRPKDERRSKAEPTETIDHAELQPAG